jgi:hypothetical protein
MLALPAHQVTCGEKSTSHERNHTSQTRDLAIIGAISADILHFPARVLVRQAARSWNSRRLCSRAWVPPIYIVPRAIPVLRAAPPDVQARGGSIGQSVNTPWSHGRVRLKGISRTTPISSLQHVSGARRPHVTAGRCKACLLNADRVFGRDRVNSRQLNSGFEALQSHLYGREWSLSRVSLTISENRQTSLPPPAQSNRTFYS